MDLDPGMAATKLAMDFLKSEALRKELVQLNDSLARVSSSLDQLITREIRAGFQALMEARATKREDIRASRLQVAEHLFLLNANLDPSQKTNNELNSRWIARSFQGLSLASQCRADHHLAAKYVLSAFAVDPRFARTELFPQIYAEFFAPCCFDIFQWLGEEKARQEASIPAIRDDFEGKAAAAAGMAIGLGGALVPIAFPILAVELAAGVLAGVGAEIAGEKDKLGALKALGNKFEKNVTDYVKTKSGPWIDAAVSRKVKSLAASLGQEFDIKIDSRCKEVARDLLANLDSAAREENA